MHYLSKIVNMVELNWSNTEMCNRVVQNYIINYMYTVTLRSSCKKVLYRYMCVESYAWQVCSPVSERRVFVQFYREWQEWILWSVLYGRRIEQVWERMSFASSLLWSGVGEMGLPLWRAVYSVTTCCQRWFLPSESVCIACCHLWDWCCLPSTQQQSRWHFQHSCCTQFESGK